VLLEHAADFDRMRLAAKTLRARLRALGLDAVLVADGKHGLALSIPLVPAPIDVEVRAFLHGNADAAVASDPALLTTEPNTADATRMHVPVATNAAGPGNVGPCIADDHGPLSSCAPREVQRRLPWRVVLTEVRHHSGTGPLTKLLPASSV